MTKPSIFGKFQQSFNNLIDSALMEESSPSSPQIEPKNQEQKLAREIQHLEIYLDTLVTALSEGKLPVNLKKVTQVFDESIAFDRLSIDIPLAKFIELYNDLPNILTGYAIDATLSDDSYRQTDNSLITFHRLNRGTYWIFPADRIGKVGTAWLVPNPLKDININRNKSLNFSFDLNLNNQKASDIILLETPALVQILPDSDRFTWKLITRGKIRTSSANSPVKRSESISINSGEITSLKLEIDKLKSEQEKYQIQQAKTNADLINSIKRLVEKIEIISPSSSPKPILKSTDKSTINASLLPFTVTFE